MSGLRWVGARAGSSRRRGAAITREVMARPPEGVHNRPMDAMTDVAAGQDTFGRMLREYRRTRRLSQLDFSLQAEISQRHLSFLESGRARPSRDMVLTLAGALDLPLEA